MGGRRIGALVVALAMIIGILGFDDATSSAQGAGSNLAHEVTATDPGEGGQIRLDSVEAFSSGRGEAVFEPGTASEERFTYSGTDGVDRLFGISRPNPVAHPSGSFVEAVPQAEASPSPRPTTTAPPSPSPSETTTTTSDSSTSSDSSGDTSTSDSSFSASDSTTTTSSSTTAVSDPCADIDCYGLVENLLMALSADPCDPYNGGIDCGALIQDVVDRIGTAEPPPDPCDPYNGGIDCDRLIQDVLDRIGTAEPPPDPCDPYNGGYDCNALVQDVLGLVNTDPCDPYNGGIDCDTLIQNVLDRLSYDPCDPYNGGYDCNAVVQDVLGLVNTDPCDPYNGGIDCDRLIQDVLDRIGTVEPPPDPCDPYNGGYDCNALVQDVLGLVNTDPCDPYNGGIDCDRLIQDVLDRIGTVEPPPDPCDPYNGGYDCNALVQDVLALLNTDPCDPYNGGIDCQRLINSIGSVMDDICPTDAATCADPYVELVGSLIDDLYYTACGPNDLSGCQAKYNDMVEALLNMVCSSTTSSGTQACIDMVSDAAGKAIDDLYYAACGPNDLSGCQAKYNDMVEGLLNAVCSSTTSSGTQACIDMVSEAAGKAIDDLYYAACGPNDLSGCQAKYKDMVEGLLNAVCSSTTSSGTQACIDMVSEAAGKAVNDLYYAACGPNDLSGCQAKYHDMVEGLLNAVCSSTTSSGTQACIDMVDVIARSAVDKAYRTACPTDTTSDACTSRYIATVVGIVTGAVDTVYRTVCSSDASPELCLARYMATVVDIGDEAIRTLHGAACGAATTSECLAHYESVVFGIRDGLYGAVCGTASPEQCTESEAAIVREALRAALAQLLNLARERSDEALFRLGTELYNLLVVGYETGDLVTDLLQPGPAPESVTITFVGADGQPSKDTEVAVYLEPYDPPCVWVPPLLVRGRTGPTGSIDFNVLEALSKANTSVDLLPDVSQEEVINVHVRAVDQLHTAMSVWHTVVPLFESHTETLALDVSLVGDPAAAMTSDDLLTIEKASVERLTPEEIFPEVVPTAAPEVDPEADEQNLDAVQGALPDVLRSNGCFAAEGATESAGGTTSDSTTSDGTTSDGTTSDGTTSDGTTSDGTTSDGTTSDGDTSDGDTSGDTTDATDHYCYDPDGQEPGCRLDSRWEWQKVSQLHSDRGVSARFRFAKGRETVAGVAVKINKGSWEARGSSVEADGREVGRTQFLNGDDRHKVVVARYLWRKFRYDQRLMNGDIYTQRYWKVINWDWETAFRFANDDPSAPSFVDNAEYKAEVPRGQTLDRKSYRNRTFEAGVTIPLGSNMSIDLFSRAGFSDQSWLAMTGEQVDCNGGNRFAFGVGKDFHQAQVVGAYAYC